MNKDTHMKKFRNRHTGYSERIIQDLKQTGVMWPRVLEAEVAVGGQGGLGRPFLGGAGVFAGT